jgi:hypothetical protein
MTRQIRRITYAYMHIRAYAVQARYRSITTADRRQTVFYLWRVQCMQSARSIANSPTLIPRARPRLMLCLAAETPAAEDAAQTLIDLGARLCKLVGTDGYRALIARALQLATVDFPVLKEVRPALAPPGRLAGLPRMVQASSNTDATGATIATLGELLGLLEQLLGEDLLEQIVGDVCPGLYDTLSAN